MSVAAQPAQSRIYGPGAIETAVVAPLAAADVVGDGFIATDPSVASAGIIDRVEAGLPDLGMDAAIGLGMSAGALVLRSAMGAGHVSRRFLEWAAPTVAAGVATAFAFGQEGMPRSIGEGIHMGIRALTAGAVARLSVNAWLHD